MKSPFAHEDVLASRFGKSGGSAPSDPQPSAYCQSEPACRHRFQGRSDVTAPTLELNLSGACRESPAPKVRVAGRELSPSPVFDTYWKFAAKRQAMYEARLRGTGGPWTNDPILKAHRFTNCFRAADRVSQFLITDVIYEGDQAPDEVVFRTLLFKFFNRVSTWMLLDRTLGRVAWNEFDLPTWDRVLQNEFDAGRRLYSAAYVVPPPRMGASRKHTNHLHLLRSMMEDNVVDRLRNADSMRDVFVVLRSYPAMGDFLAFQFLIDLNYSTVLEFDEMDFVVPGPGARDGIRKVFGPESKGIETEVIRYMAESQNEHFERLGLVFGGLRGRPLQLIDCQNLFCEVDKYARVAHPTVAGLSGRTRIKQKFKPQPEPLTAWFPPKWGLQDD
jgi:hypothetical protein